MASSVLTIPEAAEDLRISETMVWGYHRRGLLGVMYTRNVGAESSRRGPRDARIDRAEWERFKQFLTVRMESSTSPVDAASTPRRGRPPKGAPKAEGAGKWLRKFHGDG